MVATAIRASTAPSMPLTTDRDRALWQITRLAGQEGWHIRDISWDGTKLLAFMEFNRAGQIAQQLIVMSTSGCYSSFDLNHERHRCL